MMAGERNYIQGRFWKYDWQGLVMGGEEEIENEL